MDKLVAGTNGKWRVAVFRDEIVYLGEFDK